LADDELRPLFREILDRSGADANRDQLMAILGSVAGLASDKADRLDLKITNAVLKEMREAFSVFAPYRAVPKVTIFGSARTAPDDPLYTQTRELANSMAAQGWMVVTGAGPGIMAAGLEGAGRENSFGVNIRLPFEQEASEFIIDDPKLVSMKYFFTRKLMLMKESKGFVVLPGGFGTLDETFELFTLQQTGKSEPHPAVLLDVPGGLYWQEWEAFVTGQLAARQLVSPEDLHLYRRTDDPAAAVDHIVGFFRNYHSLRYVGDRLVVRMHAPPTEAELERLNERYADIMTGGKDHVDRPRIVVPFDRWHFSRLHALIADVNAFEHAPAATRDEPATKT
jgi:uncharacterized protein (TIGR00730 family)